MLRLHADICVPVQVVPVFAGGLDFSSPVKKFFYDPLGSGKNFVDCVVSLTGEQAVHSTRQCGLNAPWIVEQQAQSLLISLIRPHMPGGGYNPISDWQERVVASCLRCWLSKPPA